MSLPIPNLDDRSFDDLVAEVRSLIPRYSREWTDFNPSDPGITLIEILAWLSEMVIFRINQIPKEHVLKYMALIGIEPAECEDLQMTISRAVKYVSNHYRLITRGDYSLLALEAMKNLDSNLQGRVVCVKDRNLELRDNSKEKPGHISVIVIPERQVDYYCINAGFPEQALIKEITTALNPARLLTHRLHVVSPGFKSIRVYAELILEIGADWGRVHSEAIQNLEFFFDPVRGGSDQKGWIIGRYLYRSEVFETLEGTNAVDHIRKVTIEGSLTNKYVVIGPFEFIKIVPEIVEGFE